MYQSRLLLSLLLFISLSANAQWENRQMLHPKNTETEKVIPIDINQDGYTDIILASTAPKRISWQLNLGTPNHYSTVKVLGIFQDLYDVVAGDYDNDGDVDIIAAIDYPARIVWFEQIDGEELTFAQPQTIQEALLIGTLQFSDINSDGWPDISFSGRLADGSDQPGFHIMMGTGPASYTPLLSAPYTLGTGLVENDPYFFYPSDEASDEVDIYADWKPVGGMSQASRISFNTVSQNFEDYEIIGDGNFQIRDLADINNDGIPELMGSGFQEGIFFYSLVDDSWQRITVYGSALANSRRAVFQDIDLNGLDDIVFGLDSLIIPGPDFVPERIFWIAQIDNLSFAEALPLTTGIPSNAIIDFANIDEGTSADLLFFYKNELRPGYQSGLENNLWSSNRYFPAGLIPDHFIAGDADQDGDTDIFASDVVANTIFSFRNNGSQYFDAIHIEKANFPLPVDISGEDFNQDGKFDLLLSERRPLPDGRLFWMEKQADTWVEYNIDTAQYTLPFLFTEDMDADGDQDIVASSGVHAVVYYQNNGSGNFETRLTVPTTPSYRYVHFEDWNGDGAKDILARTVGPYDQITLHGWNGNGFDEAIQLQGSAFPPSSFFAPFDMTADGKPDIVGPFTSTISYWEHDTPINGSNTIVLDFPLSTELDRLYNLRVNQDDVDDLCFLIQFPDSAPQICWLESPADHNDPNWQFANIDSIGFVQIAYHAPILGNRSDLVTFHESDQTFRFIANDGNLVSAGKEEKPEDTFKVWPNPANTYFIIQVTNTAYEKYSIYDAQGRILQEGQLESEHTEVRIESLSAGLYFVLLSQQGKSAISVGKIVVVK